MAVVFGLLVSAALYFMLLWPGREPPEPAPEPVPEISPEISPKIP